MLSTRAERNSGDASLTIVSPIRVVDLRWRHRQARGRASSSFRRGLSAKLEDQLHELPWQGLADHFRVELVQLPIKPTVNGRRVMFAGVFHFIGRVGLLWVAGAL